MLVLQMKEFQANFVTFEGLPTKLHFEKKAGSIAEMSVPIQISKKIKLLAPPFLQHGDFRTMAGCQDEG